MIRSKPRRSVEAGRRARDLADHQPALRAQRVELLAPEEPQVLEVDDLGVELRDLRRARSRWRKRERAADAEPGRERSRSAGRSAPRPVLAAPRRTGASRQLTDELDRLVPERPQIVRVGVGGAERSGRSAPRAARRRRARRSSGPPPVVLGDEGRVVGVDDGDPHGSAHRPAGAMRAKGRRYPSAVPAARSLRRRGCVGLRGGGQPGAHGRRSGSPPTTADRTLAGDRWVEWSFCFARLADGPGTTLDFGADIGFLSLAAAQRGHDVVALDRLHDRRSDYDHERVEFRAGRHPRPPARRPALRPDPQLLLGRARRARRPLRQRRRARRRPRGDGDHARARSRPTAGWS